MTHGQDNAGSTSTAINTAPLVKLEGVSRSYEVGSHPVLAIRQLDLSIPKGSLVAVHGRSGSGKTTLLNLIGGLDKPTSGKVWLDGADVAEMNESALADVRRTKIGFIFQAFGLIPILDARENVQIPLRLVGMPASERVQRSEVLLDLVGLGDRGRHRPHELSGGEQQRVAIARALANSPQLLLADEPTGQLDSRTGRTIMNLLHELVLSEDVTAIVATHDAALIDIADRVLELKDGVVVHDRLAE